MDEMKKRIGPGAREEAPRTIHELLGMAPDEVRRDLIERGFDPVAEVAAMRRLGQSLEARHGLGGAGGAAPAARARPTFFRDAVAAGPAEWTLAERWSAEEGFWEALGPAPKDAYWARVSGRSMEGAGILDGDWVLVDRGAEPRDGDVVLAHLAGLGQVVKRLRVEGGSVWLLSESDGFDPIAVVDADSLRIHGVVVRRAGPV